MLEDNIKDRDITDDLVGKKVKALYENGWFIRDIKYFNTTLEEYKVIYPDGTSDYITKGEFDGVTSFFREEIFKRGVNYLHFNILFLNFSASSIYS